jgi:ferredoxin
MISSPGLHGEGTPAVAVVVYGNRDYDDSLLELKLKLEECAFEVRAAATFIGEHTISNRIATGRPDPNDLDTASDFGKLVASAVASGARGQLTLKGSYPFAAKGTDPTICPSTSEDCQRCGLCARNCPWGAINPTSFRADWTKCMRCGRCVRECPSGAKRFTDEAYLARIPEFEKRLASRRCEPELFLPKFQ